MKLSRAIVNYLTPSTQSPKSSPLLWGMPSCLLINYEIASRPTPLNPEPCILNHFEVIKDQTRGHIPRCAFLSDDTWCVNQKLDKHK